MGDPWVCSDALILVLPQTLFLIHPIRRSVCPTHSVRRSACPIRPVRRSVCPIQSVWPIRSVPRSVWPIRSVPRSVWPIRSDDRSTRSDSSLRRTVYQIRFVSKTNGLPSPSSTLHQTVGPGGSMRIRGEWMHPEASHPFLAPFRKVTSVPCLLPKGHIRSLHLLGDATVHWYPFDLTPFGRDTSSPVSYHSPPARVSADRTTQLGQYTISSLSSIELNAGRGRYTTHLLKGVEKPVVDVPTRPLEVVADTATEAVINKKDVVAEMEEAVVVTRDIAKVTDHVEVVVKKDTVVVAVREVAGCYGGSGV
ncbi:hypothetical protein ISN44_As01g033640 [Arabidopsis suecica]|uniref:Uncharacterized protein n=1 Tax=Arabidopsis suecica TaxID=45249 RepID=A0A8T2H7U4_ARASU|nr:hypothetical protein ISN44_As01g033640 [Arabidopsis suecica]